MRGTSCDASNIKIAWSRCTRPALKFHRFSTAKEIALSGIVRDAARMLCTNVAAHLN